MRDSTCELQGACRRAKPFTSTPTYYPRQTPTATARHYRRTARAKLRGKPRLLPLPLPAPCTIPFGWYSSYLRRESGGRHSCAGQEEPVENSCGPAGDYLLPVLLPTGHLPYHTPGRCSDLLTAAALSAGAAAPYTCRYAYRKPSIPHLRARPPAPARHRGVCLTCPPSHRHHLARCHTGETPACRAQACCQKRPRCAAPRDCNKLRRREETYLRVAGGGGGVAGGALELKSLFGGMRALAYWRAGILNCARLLARSILTRMCGGGRKQHSHHYH